MKNLLLFSLALLISVSIFGQRDDDDDYWNTWEYTAKEGMVKDFEKAAALKTATFNKTPETAISTYRVITGDDAGTYVRVESRKSPADYDLDRTAEGKYWNDNVGPFIDKNGGQTRYERIENGCYNYDPARGPATYVKRTTFNVRADKILHFRRAMHRVTKVAEKRGWKGTRILFRVVSGGNRNQFVLATTYETHKRVDDGVEHETTFKEDYDEIFGWGSLDEDWGNFDGSLEYWGEYVDTMKLVPEMSTKLGTE